MVGARCDARNAPIELRFNGHRLQRFIDRYFVIIGRRISNHGSYKASRYNRSEVFVFVNDNRSQIQIC